ncbi:MAG TPA: hypothetical protein VJV79_16905 [Polyangiaceae bacterium]|nr:hypothetical protein [Polyangiaceae bacterium]
MVPAFWFSLLLLLATPAPAHAPAARFEALAIPEFSPALVRVPEGSEKLPVIVVTHGAGGSTEAHCQWWARMLKDSAILLCVRGRARSPNPADGEYYPDHLALERETFAALLALRAGYAERIAPGGLYYAGFSQGATMGSLMLVPHAAEVTRLVLVEGGVKDWSVARARAFRAHGGERVLFVCGQKDCAEAARKSAAWFKLAGVPARVEYVAGAGHSRDSRIQARIVGALPWLTASDARWAP